MNTILVLKDQAPVMGLFRLVLQEAGYDLIEFFFARGRRLVRRWTSGGCPQVWVSSLLSEISNRPAGRSY